MSLPDSHDDALLKRLFFVAPDAMIVCDDRGRIVFINSQALQTFGYRREELLNQPVELLLPERYRAEHPQRRAQFAGNPSIRPMAVWRPLFAVDRTGREFPVEVSLSPVADNTGKFVLASIRDISEQRWMEGILRESNTALQTIACGAPLENVLANIVGLVEKGGAGIRCFILQRELWEQRQAVDGAVPSVEYHAVPIAQWNKPSRIVELAPGALHPDLGAFVVAGKLQAQWSEPIVDCGGEVLGAVVVFSRAAREPTAREAELLLTAARLAGIGMERDRRVRQFADQEERLRQKHKLEAVGSLVAGISHEFNNLLQVMEGFLDFALNQAPPQAQLHQDLLTVKGTVERAKILTRQLLSFCRRLPLRRQPIDLNALIGETVELLRPLLGKSIALSFRADDAVSTIYGDRGELQQVLMNLCINARDAMPEGGEIRIQTQSTTLVPSEAGSDRASETMGVVLTVQDTGCGMSAETKARMFEPFYTTKAQGTGTGLGLSTVYGIVRRHDGVIEVETEIGEGTTIRIHLPTAERSETPLHSMSDSCKAASGRAAATILVVDDEAPVRELLRGFLQDAGYNVITADGGDEAHRALHLHGSAISLEPVSEPPQNDHEAG